MCRVSGNISVCANNPELHGSILPGLPNGEISVFTKTPKLQWLPDDTKVEGDISVFVTTQSPLVWLGGKFQTSSNSKESCRVVQSLCN